MFSVRRFRPTDAPAVSALIAETMRVTNSKDYPPEEIEAMVAQFTPEAVLQRASWTHFYVACREDVPVACGAVGPYWGKEDESALFNIFVLPQYQGMGIGRRIVETLEADPYALRAKRIEIGASITAFDFYRRLGYTCKAGVQTPDSEGLYRLEKFR